MRALLTVFFKHGVDRIGEPPEVVIVTGADEENFITALQLKLMDYQLKGRVVVSHNVMLLP